MGRQIIPIVEKYTELDLILKHSQRLGIRPVIGIRLKLASRGSGRWKSSGGFRSKFGLTVSETLRALEQLKSLGMEDTLQLLHFHLGSQITNIRQVKGAVTEAARIYVELRRLGAGLLSLDVGGGLGIDYDGSLESKTRIASLPSRERQRLEPVPVSSVQMVSRRRVATTKKMSSRDRPFNCRPWA